MNPPYAAPSRALLDPRLDHARQLRAEGFMTGEAWCAAGLAFANALGLGLGRCAALCERLGAAALREVLPRPPPDWLGFAFEPEKRSALGLSSPRRPTV